MLTKSTATKLIRQIIGCLWSCEWCWWIFVVFPMRKDHVLKSPAFFKTCVIQQIA